MQERRWFYHPIHGGHIFEADGWPDMKYGWHRGPNKWPADKEEWPKEWSVPRNVAFAPAPRSEAETIALAERSTDPRLPDPLKFESLDDYMEDYILRLDPELKPSEKARLKKKAIDHFAAVNYGRETRGGKLEDMAEEVAGMAAEKAEKSKKGTKAE